MQMLAWWQIWEDDGWSGHQALIYLHSNPNYEYSDQTVVHKLHKILKALLRAWPLNWGRRNGLRYLSKPVFIGVSNWRELWTGGYFCFKYLLKQDSLMQNSRSHLFLLLLKKKHIIICMSSLFFLFFMDFSNYCMRGFIVFQVIKGNWVEPLQKISSSSVECCITKASKFFFSSSIFQAPSS